MLLDYLNTIKIPDIKLSSLGTISNAFLEIGILTLWDAIVYVKQLPYGRTTDREKYQQVLLENKGTCSTKHALIATLAEEVSVPLTLKLGIFLLSAKSHPQITHVLEHYGLEAIPEAHCFLQFGKNTLDITFPASLDFSVKENLEYVISVAPSQIGDFKLNQHHNFIKRWVANKSDLKFDSVWKARECCIQQLS